MLYIQFPRVHQSYLLQVIWRTLFYFLYHLQRIFVSTEGASAGATTIGNVAAGDDSGANDAAFASRAASVEADFRKATRDEERLPFWPIPEVGGLFELFMAIGNRGLPTNLESKTCGSGYLDSLGTCFWIDGRGVKTPSCHMNVV